MSILFPKKPKPVVDPAETAADWFRESAEEELARISGFHQVNFRKFWDGPNTPDAIMQAMGAEGARYLQAAGASADHLVNLAAIAGKDITEVIPLEYLIPRRAFIIAGDGTVTLEPPAEGYDAWGRLIQKEEPEAEEPKP